MRSVSSASFTILGEAAFDRTVRIAASWIRLKNRAVRPEAERGEPFDVGGGGEHTARAIRQQFGDATIWAATLDDPDASHLGRTWVTEMTVAQRGAEALFGARLFNVTRGMDGFFSPSLPGLIRELVESVPCGSDGRMLASHAEVVAGPDDVDRLVELIERPGRRLPVVVVAEGRNRREFADPDMVAKRLAGAAHVFRILDEMTWELSRLLGRQLSVFDGGTRIYAGGLRRDEADPFDHPLWVTRPDAPLRQHGNAVVAWVLNAGARRGEDYPRFAAVRETSAALELEARRAIGDTEGLRPLYEEENARLRQELAAVRSEHQQWLQDAEEERSAASRRIQEIQADAARFRGRYEQMRAALAQGATSSPRERLDDLSAFQTWMQRNVGPNVWFAPKAVRAVEKNHQFADPGLIGDTIHALEDQFVAMKREPGARTRSAYLQRLAELGLEDTPCFTDRNDLKRFPEYSVVYRDEKRWCDRHLKHGGGADPKSMFRIYFCWDEDEQVVLIGHLPTHLDNNMTN